MKRLLLIAGLLLAECLHLLAFLWLLSREGCVDVPRSDVPQIMRERVVKHHEPIKDVHNLGSEIDVR